jgi:hypothetical protein
LSIGECCSLLAKIGKKVKSGQNDVVKFEAKLTTSAGPVVGCNCNDLVEFLFATEVLFIVVDGTIMAFVVVGAMVVVGIEFPYRKM